MFRSLRFRLPALFLLGIVVSGLIAAAIALRLFQGYVQDRLKEELRRDAVGLTELYQEQTNRENAAARAPPAAADVPPRLALEPAGHLRVHAAGHRPALRRRRQPAAAVRRQER